MHPGNSASAPRQQQARYILELIADLGGRALFRTIREHARLTEQQLHEALLLLNQHGCVNCRVRMDNLVVYAVTLLGSDTIDLLQDLGDSRPAR